MASKTKWKSIFEQAYEKTDLLDEVQLVDLFQKTEPYKPNADRILKPEPKRKKEIVRFLDSKISQNLEILLTSFKVPHSAIRDALLHINDDLLTLDRLSNIRPMIPESEILESILTYQGPLEQLGKAETFIKIVYDVPRLPTRIDSMIFRHRLHQELIEIEPDTYVVLRAIDQIKTSELFSLLLQMILIIGNYLNGTSFRGNANGFKIDSLLTIKDTRAISGNNLGCPTLLHYIAKFLAEKQPRCLDFMAEMPDVEPAGRMSIHGLVDGVKSLAAGLAQVQDEVKAVQHLGVLNGDEFLIVFENFCHVNCPKLDELSKNVIKLEEELQTLFEEFAEDLSERKNEPQLFFETITEFSQMLLVLLANIESTSRKRRP